MRSNGASAVHAALVVAGTCGIIGLFSASPALAQRSHPQTGRGGTPALPLTTILPTTPAYPGASVTVDPRWYGVQPLDLQRPGHRHRRLHMLGPGSFGYSAPTVYYSPYVAYGGVNDVNGVPLASYFESRPAAPPAPPAAMGDPDLRGSPYVVIDGGAMVVDFGNGDRRTVAACAAVAAAQTPDGQPRTIFYTPPADGVVLRSGAKGRVLGTPGAGARVCYEVDQYGRMVLDY